MLDETPASAPDGVEAIPIDKLAELARAQIVAIDQMYEVDRGVGGMTRWNFAAYMAWQDATEGSYSHADTVLRLIGMIPSTPPADDVREALAEMFFYAESPHARWKAGHEGDAAEHLYQNAYSRADDALALVRPRGTVTDAEVEAAAQAMFEDGTGLPGDYTWAQMVEEDPSRADIWRADARRVLRAAQEAQR